MIVQITSVQNPRVKAAVALREQRERRNRGLTLIDGVREISRACQAGVPIKEVFFCPAEMTPAAEDFLPQLDASQVELCEVTPRVLEKLSFGDRREGIVAVAAVAEQGLEGLRLDWTRPPLLAVLEGLEKPGNVGALLRTADAAGISAVIATDLRTDLYNPNIIRASLGTVFTLPVATSPSEAVLSWLRGQGCQIVAAMVDGALRYDQADYSKPTALVLGSEAQGLSGVWRQTDVIPVHIPMLGCVDSLNVSVAGAILLYEAQRQRGFPRPT